MTFSTLLSPNSVLSGAGALKKHITHQACARRLLHLSCVNGRLAKVNTCVWFADMKDLIPFVSESGVCYAGFRGAGRLPRKGHVHVSQLRPHVKGAFHAVPYRSSVYAALEAPLTDDRGVLVRRAK